MSYRLLLVDATGSAVCRPLRLRELRRFPGEGVSVHFRPIRNDRLFESAKSAGSLAYRILFGEGVARTQLWVEYEVPGEHVNVTGRSSDLLFALALITAAWKGATNTDRVIAATGIVDADGSVRGVERPAQKIAAAIRDLGTAAVPALIFYPAANAPEVAVWSGGTEIPPHVQLRPVERVEEALSHLGYVLERVYLRNPFRGLEQFDYEHHAIFFGRDREVRDAVEQLLRREAAGAAGLLIEGPSGSGKSSFLRAGVLPALVNPQHLPAATQERMAARPVNSEVRHAIWRPGLTAADTDESGLARSIAVPWSNYIGAPVDTLLGTPPTLQSLAQSLEQRQDPDRRWVWVIDQFEEIFTVGLEERLLDLFGHFLQDLQRHGIWTLISIRVDATSELKRREAVRVVFGANEGQYYLRTVSGVALDDVISRPAVAANLTFGLTPSGRTLEHVLREEAYSEPDSLPLLQFTLNELYLRRSGNELTFQAHQELGGLAGAIATTAQAILQADTADMKRAIPRLLRALVTVDETGRATRRYATLSEVGQDETQRKLVERLVSARLCVTDQRSGEPAVAFAHDSLLRTLPALIDWLREETGLLQTRELARREAELWEQHGRSDAWLAAADKLVAFRALQAADIVPSSSIRAYIDRSERHVRRLARIKQAAVALIALLAVAASIGAWLSTQRVREAQYQTVQARKAQLQLLTEAAAERLKDGDLTFARSIVLEVLRQRPASVLPDPAAMNVLQEIRATDPASVILVGHSAAVRRVAYSPDGTRIVTASLDHTARIWDANTGVGLLNLVGHTRAVLSVRYSPSGDRVLTASSDKTGRIWDAHSGRELLKLEDPKGIAPAVYSPDGARIATSSEEGVIVWDAKTGARLAQFLATEAIGPAEFSPDGTRLIVGVGRTARVLDSRTGRQLQVLSGHHEDLASAVYSPDSKSILTGSADNTARIWDAQSGKLLHVLSGHIGMLDDAVFSPNGKWAATSSTDKTVRLWDPATGNLLRVLTGHVNIVGGIAFSPDGLRAVTGGWDLTARVWDLHEGPRDTLVLQHADRVGGVAFSADGKRLITTTQGKVAQIWDAHTGAPLATVNAEGHEIAGALYSPDGRWLLVAADDKSLLLLDARSRQKLRSIPIADAVTSMAFSRNGSLILIGFADFTFAEYDASTGERLKRSKVAGRDWITSAEYSPDGKRIATSSIDKTLRLWDARTLRQLEVHPHKDFLNQAVWSPDGSLIVTAANDSLAHVWDARSGELVRDLVGHHAFVFSVGFSPDGQRIVTGSKDRTIRIWETRTGLPLAVLCCHGALVGGVTYSPDGTRIASSSTDETARIWNAAVPADWRSQIAWEEAVESDPLSDVQRTHLGIPSTMTLLANVALAGAAASGTPFYGRTTAESVCHQQAAAYYDPDRTNPGLAQEAINADMATQACSPISLRSNASARSIYETGRALTAKEDFTGARRNFELALSGGYRAAAVDLARLLTNPVAHNLDTPRALALLEKAWKQGVLISGFDLGSLYERGVQPLRGTQVAPFSPDVQQAWRWYERAAARSEPHAMARLADRLEHRALEETPVNADDRLLEAFGLYGRAARLAELQGWPDGVWRGWVYRRSSLARLLAADNRMQAVADSYRKILSEPVSSKRSQIVGMR